MNYERLKVQLELHEGSRARAYLDTVGKVTVGIGRNLSDKGLAADEIDYLYHNDIRECVEDLESYPWFSGLGDVRQRVVTDLRFNLGPHRFRLFKRMLGALAVGDYQKASVSMRESLWFRQVKTRGERLVKMMQTGEDFA